MPSAFSRRFKVKPWDSDTAAERSPHSSASGFPEPISKPRAVRRVRRRECRCRGKCGVRSADCGVTGSRRSASHLKSPLRGKSPKSSHAIARDFDITQHGADVNRLAVVAAVIFAKLLHAENFTQRRKNAKKFYPFICWPSPKHRRIVVNLPKQSLRACGPDPQW